MRARILDLHPKDDPYKQPRPNVIYELEWFAGRWGRERTLMVLKKGTTIPSDLSGIERIGFDKDISEQLLRLRTEIDEWRSGG